MTIWTGFAPLALIFAYLVAMGIMMYPTYMICWGSRGIGDTPKAWHKELRLPWGLTLLTYVLYWLPAPYLPFVAVTRWSLRTIEYYRWLRSHIEK